jgi:hypothetical protein
MLVCWKYVYGAKLLALYVTVFKYVLCWLIFMCSSKIAGFWCYIIERCTLVVDVISYLCLSSLGCISLTIIHCQPFSHNYCMRIYWVGDISWMSISSQVFFVYCFLGSSRMCKCFSLEYGRIYATFRVRWHKGMLYVLI